MSHYKVRGRAREARARETGKRKAEKEAAVYGSEKKKRRKKERRSERQVHHGDTPSIILRRERKRENKRERKETGGREMAVAGERKREKDLSHECCVWSSFMVVRLNSRSEEGEFRKWRRAVGFGGPRPECRAWQPSRPHDDTGYLAIEEDDAKNDVIGDMFDRARERDRERERITLEIFRPRQAILFHTGNCALARERKRANDIS